MDAHTDTNKNTNTHTHTRERPCFANPNTWSTNKNTKQTIWTARSAGTRQKPGKRPNRMLASSLSNPLHRSGSGRNSNNRPRNHFVTAVVGPESPSPIRVQAQRSAAECYCMGCPKTLYMEQHNSNHLYGLLVELKVYVVVKGSWALWFFSGDDRVPRPSCKYSRSSWRRRPRVGQIKS